MMTQIQVSTLTVSSSAADLWTDIRYVVARMRYECTHLIRSVLLGHFEDRFTSFEAVSEVANEIEALGSRVKDAVERVLQVGSKLSRSQLTVIYQEENVAEPNDASVNMDGAWPVSASEERPYVVGFAIWAASLMHLMLHKAYCVLYFPLAKNRQSSLGSDVRLT